ncbi:hypothetical protein ABE10_12675 [Bacillus toyonensis]|nr:hypothetical protein [Bacillus toyonensis]
MHIFYDDIDPALRGARRGGGTRGRSEYIDGDEASCRVSHPAAGGAVAGAFEDRPHDELVTVA